MSNKKLKQKLRSIEIDNFVYLPIEDSQHSNVVGVYKNTVSESKSYIILVSKFENNLFTYQLKLGQVPSKSFSDNKDEFEKLYSVVTMTEGEIIDKLHEVNNENGLMNSIMDSGFYDCIL